MADMEKLAQELADDPLGRGYSTMTDQQAADALNAPDRAVTEPTTATSKTLMARMNPADAAAILEALDAASGTNAVVKWMMHHVTNDGVDLGHANTRDQVQALADGGVLTQAQADAMLSLAVTTMSRAEGLNLLGRSREIGPAHVAQARS